MDWPPDIRAQFNALGDAEATNPIPNSRAVAKLGALAADEGFAFEPAHRRGGKASLAHLVRRDAHVQSSLLAQLGGLEVLDRVALARRAFGQTPPSGSPQVVAHWPPA